LQSKFYLTTAIDYANARPHLGTAYEKIGADVLSRFHRLVGDDVYFQMGNDEHSANVEKRARELGLDPKEYCDKMAEAFLGVWRGLQVEPDRFIRTTDSDHVQTVQALLERMRANGDIVSGTYQGFYCISCEAYIKEGDLVDGLCPHHKQPPQKLQEENLFFRLSRYTKRLLEHFREDPSFVLPSSRYNELLEILERGLEDISISRKGKGWGIPIPWDPSQRVYVWVDALINYVSGAGFMADRPGFLAFGLATSISSGKISHASTGLSGPRFCFPPGLLFQSACSAMDSYGWRARSFPKPLGERSIFRIC